MCEHCNNGWVTLPEPILDTLIIASGLKAEDLTNLITKAVKTNKLTFKPDKDMGEGEATEEELKYRQLLLDLAKSLYEDVSKVMGSQKDPNIKIENIDKLITTFIKDADKIVNETLPKTWNNSVEDGIKELKRLKPKETYNPKKVDTTKKELIIQQQTSNIEDIAHRLQGRLRQFILIRAIQSNNQSTKQKSLIKKAGYPSTWTSCMIKLHEQEPDLTEDELREQCEGWKDSFNDVQNNLDKLGLFGWLTTNHLAFYSTLLYGAVIIGEIVADWVTQGDDRVCDECLEREAGSPYSIFDNIWLDSPHFGCRCWMDNIRLRTEQRDELII